MAKYKIFYDGKWRGTYSTKEEAEQVAEIESASREEFVLVIKAGLLRNEFLTAYPSDQAAYAQGAWEAMKPMLPDLRYYRPWR